MEAILKRLSNKVFLSALIAWVLTTFFQIEITPEINGYIDGLLKLLMLAGIAVDPTKPEVKDKPEPKPEPAKEKVINFPTGPYTLDLYKEDGVVTLEGVSGEYFVEDNFQLKEFLCSSGAKTVVLDEEFLKNLQLLRDYLKKPINITTCLINKKTGKPYSGGYRTDAWNKKIGGANNSLHTQGKAVDVFVDGMTHVDVCKAARDIGMTDNWYYPGHAHIGMRNDGQVIFAPAKY